MTIQEYVTSNLPFYHITPAQNRDPILKQGLLPGKKVKAICVVRSIDENVIQTIASSQLSCDGDRDFVVFKLLPKKHCFGAEDIGPDKINELTAPLHNYIYKNVIKVDESDIELEFSVQNTDAPSKETIVKLSGYVRNAPQDILIYGTN